MCLVLCCVNIMQYVEFAEGDMLKEVRDVMLCGVECKYDGIYNVICSVNLM